VTIKLLPEQRAWEDAQRRKFVFKENHSKFIRKHKKEHGRV